MLIRKDEKPLAKCTLILCCTQTPPFSKGDGGILFVKFEKIPLTPFKKGGIAAIQFAELLQIYLR
jgi:hypothetical protein